MANQRITLSAPLNRSELFAMARAMQGFSTRAGDSDNIEMLRDQNEAGEHRTLFTVLSTQNAEFNEEEFLTLERGDYSDDELVAALLRLPKGFESFHQEVSQGFQLPEPDERHFAINRKQDETRERYWSEVKKAVDRLPKLQSNPNMVITPTNAKSVSQSSKEVLKPDDEKEVLFTVGVATCIAVGMVNQRDHTIALAHVAAAADLPRVESMKEWVQTKPDDKVDVVLWGGKKNHSELLAGALIGCVQAQPGFILKSVDVCDPARVESDISAIALSRSGDIRLETYETMSALTAKPAINVTDEQLGCLLKTIRAMPTSIQPGSPSLKRQDRGMGITGKGEGG